VINNNNNNNKLVAANFQKMQEPLKNSRYQKGDKKQELY